MKYKIIFLVNSSEFDSHRCPHFVHVFVGREGGEIAVRNNFFLRVSVGDLMNLVASYYSLAT